MEPQNLIDREAPHRSSMSFFQPEGRLFPIMGTQQTSTMAIPPMLLNFEESTNADEEQYKANLDRPIDLFQTYLNIWKYGQSPEVYTPNFEHQSPTFRLNNIELMNGLNSVPNTTKPEVLFTVQGRLALTARNRLFHVTKEEIFRRTNFPEYMCSSTLAALLRQGKVKDIGSSMRDKLKAHGIVLKLQQKKRIPIATGFTSLLEGEALLLAQELQDLVGQHFPKKEYAQLLVESDALTVGSVDNNLQELKKEAIYALRFLQRLGRVANHLHISVGEQNYPENRHPLNQQMSLFSAYTHGFGPANHKTWIGLHEQIALDVLHIIQANENIFPY